jgi:hypothetical protein
MMNEHPEIPAVSRHRFAPLLLLFVLATICGDAVTAAEVYSWTDENGVVHYSDSPPASGKTETLQVEEIYRPGSADVYGVPEQAPEASPVETGEATPEAPPSVAEARRQQMARERAERQEAQAETERLCAQHRQRVEQMEPARRVIYTDDKGESVRMDDDQRLALIEASKDFLAKNCRD